MAWHPLCLPPWHRKKSVVQWNASVQKENPKRESKTNQMKKTILAMVVTMFVAVQAYAVTGTIGFTGGTSGMTQKTNKKTGVTTNHFNNPWSVIAGSQSGDYA